jgi:hypothetical protein
MRHRGHRAHQSRTDFAEFARIIDMRFHPFSLADIDAKNAMSHWVVWNWGPRRPQRRCVRDPGRT